MSKFKLCFIFDEDGDYKPIPYAKLMDGKERRDEYANKYFLPLTGYLLEVSREDYLDHYKRVNRQEYIRKEAKRAGEISLENFNSFDNEDFGDLYEDVAEKVVSTVMAQNLHLAIGLLTDEERRLIQLLYFEEQTERQCAEIFNLSKNAIHNRKHRIIKKLKNILGV